MTTLDEGGFAEAVKAWRIGKQLSVEAAAKAAGVSPGTWRSAEKGETIRDLSRGSIGQTIDLAWSPEPLDVAEAVQVADVTRDQLNPELAGFTDADLLHEVQMRMLLMAASLTALGSRRLAWRVSDEGWPEVTSGVPS